MLTETLREQWARSAQLDAEVCTIERRLAQRHRSNDASRRIASVVAVAVNADDRREVLGMAIKSAEEERPSGPGSSARSSVAGWAESS